MRAVPAQLSLLYFILNYLHPRSLQTSNVPGVTNHAHFDSANMTTTNPTTTGATEASQSSPSLAELIKPFFRPSRDVQAMTGDDLVTWCSKVNEKATAILTGVGQMIQDSPPCFERWEDPRLSVRSQFALIRNATARLLGMLTLARDENAKSGDLSSPAEDASVPRFPADLTSLLTEMGQLQCGSPLHVLHQASSIAWDVLQSCVATHMDTRLPKELRRLVCE